MSVGVTKIGDYLRKLFNLFPPYPKYRIGRSIVPVVDAMIGVQMYSSAGTVADAVGLCDIASMAATEDRLIISLHGLCPANTLINQLGFKDEGGDFYTMFGCESAGRAYLGGMMAQPFVLKKGWYPSCWCNDDTGAGDITLIYTYRVLEE